MYDHFTGVVGKITTDFGEPTMYHNIQRSNTYSVQTPYCVKVRCVAHDDFRSEIDLVHCIATSTQYAVIQGNPGNPCHRATRRHFRCRSCPVASADVAAVAVVAVVVAVAVLILIYVI